MGIKLSLELSDRDLRYFRRALKEARSAVRHAGEAEIVEAIRDVLDEIRRSKPLPDFVARLLPELDTLILMLTDQDWRLPRAEREQLLATFVYFGDPEDILPDDVPVIGFLDDIIVIELVSREMRHVREAYDDFCSFRERFDAGHGRKADPAQRRERLERRRRELHERMRRRAKRDAKAGIW